MKSNLVSIIVPAYNASKTIENTINSLLKQTYNNIEIIIINDSSEDNTAEIVRRMCKQYNKIKLLNLEVNCGVVGAYTKGIKSSFGEYICFVDADDSVSIDYVKKLVSPLLIDNSIDLCVANFAREWESVWNIARSPLKTGVHSDKDIFYETIFGDTIAPMRWSKLFKKKIILQFIDKLDWKISIGEDVIFILLYINQIKRFYYIDDCLYYYAYNENSITNQTISLSKLTAMKGSIDFISKNIHSKGADKTINTISYAIINKLLALKLNRSNQKAELNKITSYKLRCKYNSDYVWGSHNLKQKIYRHIYTLSPLFAIWIVKFFLKCCKIH